MNKQKLLIVDDEVRILTSLEDLFEDTFEVTATTDAEVALRFVEENEVAVVLSDERMPGLKGDEFLRKVKTLSNAVRLLMTGYADIDALMRAVNHGQIYAYVAKPWDPVELNQIVAKAATHHELLRAVEYERSLLRALMENVPDVIFFKDSDSRYTRLNQAQARVLGVRDPQDCIGKMESDFLNPDDRAAKEEQDIFRTAKPLVEKIEQLCAADGRVSWMSTTKVPLVDRNGLVSGIAGISRDITELKRIESALRTAHDELELRVNERTAELCEANLALSREVAEHDQAKQQAEQANKAKGEFLSLMSHELRTPLNSILGFAQILNMDESPPRSRECLGYILSGGRHLLRLIEDILDIARIGSGKAPLSLEPVLVSGAIQDAVNMVQIQAADHGIGVFVEAGVDGQSHVLTDRRRLSQVLLNLLSNAMKYNCEAGTVRVSAEATTGGRLRITVMDTGPGISPEDQGKLFEPFERLAADRTGVGGTGLGLALSKRLVEAMGGSIGLRSELGTGTSFWVEFPVAQAPAGRASAAEDLLDHASAKLNGKRLNVLYIEDDAANMRLMKEIVSYRPQVTLHTATEGGPGFKAAVDSHPDLILLDIDLPDIQGDEVLRRLQSDPRTVNIPTFILSADANAQTITRMLAAGAQDYLTKPLDVSAFLNLLDKYLQEAGAILTQLKEMEFPA